MAFKRTRTVKKVSKRTKFPKAGVGVSPKTESQKKRASGKSSHRERVIMRAMLRQAGVIDPQASNDVADIWLDRHGYLYHKGYQPPTHRVLKLAHSLGIKPPTNV